MLLLPYLIYQQSILLIQHLVIYISPILLVYLIHYIYSFLKISIKVLLVLEHLIKRLKIIKFLLPSLLSFNVIIMLHYNHHVNIYSLLDQSIHNCLFSLNKKLLIHTFYLHILLLLLPYLLIILTFFKILFQNMLLLFILYVNLFSHKLT